MSDKAVCPVCPHHCQLPEGSLGRCHARINRNGTVVSSNYGKITSIALDPIEKKPLAFFYPGSKILSVGSYGCNLSCPFCQNYDIASIGEEHFAELHTATPEKLLEIAQDTIPEGNIGIAYTYNEALVGYEFVLDTAKLIRKAGMINVLVTNGNACKPVLEKILPYIDAMNIDLKCFTEDGYKKLGGDLRTVMEFIEESLKKCHVEITSLIVPGLNDSPEEMEEEAAWIASLDPDIPLHITRYFPRYKYREAPTDINLMKELKAVAEKHLNRVLLGNV
ncbi:MAG: AmmeMemoRadiSam system radical SAM enzyme [Lachnospiraceae bacterium]|nr:AmmeMemoRadiSam system radical SAM enzyme [Lachnospiraceae bacterium]